MEHLSALLRWAHIVAGIFWIGMLYFFNFMNAHLAATYDADTKKKVVPELMPRALYWFRWGAAFTWVTGVLMLMLVFYHGGLMFDGPDQGWTWVSFVMLALVFVIVPIGYDFVFKIIKAKQPLGIIVASVSVAAMVFMMAHCAKFGYRSYVIHLGSMFGTIMAMNVWMRIWPAQRRIVTAIKNAQAPNPDDVALAGLRSKHNTYMSVPLVWCMINAHTTVVGAGCFCWLLGAVALGWGFVYWLYKKSATVKGF